MKKAVCILALLGLLISCSKKETAVAEENTTVVQQSCMYKYAKDSTRVAWTAFKFTEKVGVGGKFDQFEVTGAEMAASPEELVQSMSFKIPIASVNTNNPERDGKIKAHFFGSLANTDFITGKVKSISGSKGIVTLMLNEVERDLEMEYSANDGKVSLSSVMNVGEWNAMAGIDKLNQVCDELHKGTDGLSKLWPEVKLNISSQLIKTCN